MIEQLLNMFGQSPQGQQAYSQLQAQGYTPNQSAGILTTAFPAAVAGLQKAMSNPAGGGLGLLNITEGHYATNFLSAAVTGLLKGDGLKGAAIDGVEGIVGGHVAEVIASRCGLPQRVAGVVGAIITPLMIHFLWDKIQHLQAGGLLPGGQPGAAPGMPPGMAPQAPPGMPGAPGGFGSSFNLFGR